MNFGEKIKNYRKENGLTQDDLAEQLHVSRQSISKWETGNAYPSYSLLIDISKLLNESVDELLSSREIVEETVDYKNKKKRNRIILISAITVALVSISVSVVSLALADKSHKKAESLQSLVQKQEEEDEKEDLAFLGLIAYFHKSGDSLELDVNAFENRLYPGIYLMRGTNPDWKHDWKQERILKSTGFAFTGVDLGSFNTYFAEINFNYDYIAKSNLNYLHYLTVFENKAGEIVWDCPYVGVCLDQTVKESTWNFEIEDSYKKYGFTLTENFYDCLKEPLEIREYSESFQLIKETQISNDNYQENYKINEETLYLVVDDGGKKSVIWNEDLPMHYLFKVSDDIFFNKYIYFENKI